MPAKAVMLAVALLCAVPGAQPCSATIPGENHCEGGNQEPRTCGCPWSTCERRTVDTVTHKQQSKGSEEEVIVKTETFGTCKSTGWLAAFIVAGVSSLVLVSCIVTYVCCIRDRHTTQVVNMRPGDGTFLIPRCCCGRPPRPPATPPTDSPAAAGGSTTRQAAGTAAGEQSAAASTEPDHDPLPASVQDFTLESQGVDWVVMHGVGVGPGNIGAASEGSTVRYTSERGGEEADAFSGATSSVRTMSSERHPVAAL